MSDVNSPQGEEPVLEAGQEAAAEVPGSGADEASLDDWAAAMAEQNSNDAPAAAPAAVFQPLSKVDQNSTRNDIDMILDIPVQMTVELGRTKIAIRNLLQLAQGSVVELDGLAGEPMDVLVNGCLIAQGEVVVVNDKFGIRLTDIITPSERIRKLNR
ncbi:MULTISPECIES: flagellar motor switch protein FliN [Paraburkholderia]|jgi:flagellar motor switch protein FliN|uniref:Flagellar motor switch protein FliN n=1 Tax=Paraburkholderia tropica TaxID=92647 RepID=A0A1A5X0X4_9BURK|nr:MULTISPECIES: flagellar motor switch protein FliN [Paraburkholderia]MBB2977858.1 flagellar motor switch protein FliN/FliY [Paraburkholderia tropica]MBB2998456.1 flagellar motor switch protein FliN/FliY [Paraburkholderia tropica]MBB6317498.1 flagellar motor switch protein FliN/FliY [Paraburkholderia tropica]MDE1142537.1 flagellar motor switch protein FliN [Paraburkholderia tropica]OBR46785.1 flagellar motor switch protein FliN [Paraburkholderia tropica]